MVNYYHYFSYQLKKRKRSTNFLLAAILLLTIIILGFLVIIFASNPAEAQSSQQLLNIINQYRNLNGNLNNLIGMFNNISGQMSGNLGGQFNNLIGQLSNLAGQFNNLIGQLGTGNLSNLTFQFSNLQGQLGNIMNQLGGLTNQLPAPLQSQFGNLMGQFNNLSGQLSGITQQLGGLAGVGGGLGGVLGGGLLGGGNSVPVYETNKDMLGDIKTTSEKTTDILKQMQMEWDFFRNNEKTKWEYFKKAQDKINKEIKEGDDGNPLWIRDYVDYLSTPGAKTAKVFYSELDEKNFLCESFNEQIKQMFNPEKTVKFSEKGPGGAACTISDSVNDINAFYDDFSQGGWQAFNELLEPQNNIFGAYLLADDELTMRQNIANKAVQTEALAGQGYMSNRGSKDCEEEVNGICVRNDIGIPGYNYAEQAGALAASELEYIENAGDLVYYSQDIGDTFLDRMFNEIADFFAEIISSGTQLPPPVDDPCSFVKIFGNEAYELCKKLIGIGASIVDFIKRNGVNDIQKAVDHLTQAINYKQSSLSLINNLISTLNELANCQEAIGVSNADTLEKINEAQQLSNVITLTISVFQDKIAGLNETINLINSLTDQTKLTSTIETLFKVYNISAAFQEKEKAQSENENISNYLTQIQNELTDCQNQLPLPSF